MYNHISCAQTYIVRFLSSSSRAPHLGTDNLVKLLRNMREDLRYVVLCNRIEVTTCYTLANIYQLKFGMCALSNTDQWEERFTLVHGELAIQAFYVKTNISIALLSYTSCFCQCKEV